MIVKRYWDYTERERADMTSEQVEGLLTAELMEAGVIRVDPPILLPTDSPEIPGVTMYCIKAGWSVINEIGFRSAEDAAEAMKNAVPLGSEYIGGMAILREGDKNQAITIEPTLIRSRADIANHRSAVEKANANTAANDAALAQYRKDSEAVEKVLSGVWDDYRVCQRKQYNLQKIVDTYREYLAICDGDANKAAKFLAKAFPKPSINEAFEWFDIEVPDEQETVAMASQ